MIIIPNNLNFIGKKNYIVIFKTILSKNADCSTKCLVEINLTNLNTNNINYYNFLVPDNSQTCCEDCDSVVEAGKEFTTSVVFNDLIAGDDYNLIAKINCLEITPTPTISVTPTITSTPTVTPTISVTPTATPTATVTPTISVTPTVTPTPTTAPVLNKIPLEDSGGSGTANGHWENNYRDNSYSGGDGFSYPGVSNELMVGTVSPGQTRILSKLSIGSLVDFGYIENNPGSSEGNPTTANNLLIGQNISKQEEIHLNCRCNLLKHKISTITILSKNSTDMGVLSSHLLFDKSSWASVVPEPYKTYLDQAADRWALYMSYNSSVVTAIRGLSGFSTWNGLALNPSEYTLYNGEPGTIASSGPWDYVDLQPAGPGVQFNSLTFQLNINNYYLNIFSSLDWINIMTHELGHALGIGIYWDSTLESAGSIPPQNNFLNGNYYINSKNAYLDIISN